jgi:sulfate transport system substrate-binding protein
MRTTLVIGGGLLALALVVGVIASQVGGGVGPELLNVSYDPTRELWRDLNAQFVQQHLERTGQALSIRQSHGGSGSQARAVIDGLEADVVTLALWTDTDAIRKKGLIKDGWEDRMPDRSLPYYSTIVFVVRKGNELKIKDWADLAKPQVKIITPNPKTSGNGKLTFLAAWGAVLSGAVPGRAATEEEARKFVAQLYRQTPVLDSGARGATTTFAQKGLGDVHITWENEAQLEVLESKGELEIVYPSVSIRAEPHVALVDVNVDRKGTRATAETYLKFLYTDQAQETIAKHYYRPSNETVLKKHQATFPDLKLFPITTVARDWNDAQERFFAEGGEFDKIYSPSGK